MKRMKPLQISLFSIIAVCIISCTIVHINRDIRTDFKNTVWSGHLSDGDTIIIELSEQMTAHIKYRDKSYNILWATDGQDASLEGAEIACEPRYVWDINKNGNLGKKWVESIMLNNIIHSDDMIAFINWKYDNNSVHHKDTLYFLKK